MSLLIGTIGNAAAGDLMAFAKLAHELPSIESIKTDPHNASVPQTASALMMVIYRVMDVMDAQMIDPWFCLPTAYAIRASGCICVTC